MAIFCANCGASLLDGAKFCDTCGTPVRTQQQNGVPGSPQAANLMGTGAGTATGNAGAASCPVCGAPALPGEAFCDNCGAALLAPGSYAPAQPTSYPAPANQPVVQYQQSQPNLVHQPAVASRRAAAIVITNPPPPATLTVPGAVEMIVGRSDPQSNSYPDIDLGPYGGLDLGISRRHFRLTRAGDQFYIEDLQSVNGTVINGQRIPAHSLHPLHNGDRIALGKMELTFELT